MDDDAKFLLMVYGPILALAWTIALLDWAGRRKTRKTQGQKHA